MSTILGPSAGARRAEVASGSLFAAESQQLVLRVA